MDDSIIISSDARGDEILHIPLRGFCPRILLPGEPEFGSEQNRGQEKEALVRSV